MHFVQIVLWWFSNKCTHHHGNVGIHNSRGIGGQGSGSGGSSGSAPHAAAGLCDEVVTLWRLAALNPSLTSAQRNDLSTHLSQWQYQSLDRLYKLRQMNLQASGGSQSQSRASDLEAVFPGFRPAIEACQLDWTNLALPGGVADLLKHRSQWGQVSGAWLPLRVNCTPANITVVGSPTSQIGTYEFEMAGKEDTSAGRNDKPGNNSIWFREAGRKVLMPSERSPHSTLRPTHVKSAARKSDLDELDGTTSEGSVNGIKPVAAENINLVEDNTNDTNQISATNVSSNSVLTGQNESAAQKTLETSLSALSIDGDIVQTESNSVSKESKQEVSLLLTV